MSDVGLVHSFHVFNAVYERRNFGELGDALIDIEGEFGSAYNTGLGGDDDDTVTAAHTVNGCRGSVLRSEEHTSELQSR